MSRLLPLPLSRPMTTFLLLTVRRVVVVSVRMATVVAVAVAVEDEEEEEEEMQMHGIALEWRRARWRRKRQET